MIGALLDLLMNVDEFLKNFCLTEIFSVCGFTKMRLVLTEAKTFSLEEMKSIFISDFPFHLEIAPAKSKRKLPNIFPPPTFGISKFPDGKR